MKYFIIATAVLAIARAGVIVPVAVKSVAAPAIVAAVPAAVHSSQYHAQDAIGQYSYGYTNELSAKNEIKSADGETVGAYSYIDAEGKLQNVQYRSDALHGFRVSATNLPVAPKPIEAAPLPMPEPVQDTPEVVEARAKHLEALHQAEEAAKKISDSVSVEVKSTSIDSPQPAALISTAIPAAVVKAAPAPTELIRTAPVLAAPSFGYSFGINYGGTYSVNSYSLDSQPIVTAFAVPAHFIATPVVAGTAPIAGHLQAIVPEPPKDLPEVVEARASHLQAAENIKRDVEKEQKSPTKE